jgi:uncharacterized protein (TIGR02300 family)
MQDKSKLGRRYHCFQCSLKFYDLNRPDPLCPKCGADQRENPNPDPRDAILARFKGKAKVARIEDEFGEDEEGEEELDVGEEEELDDEEDEPGEEAPAADEED